MLINMNRTIKKHVSELENTEVLESPLGFLIQNVSKDYISYLGDFLGKIHLSPSKIYYLLALSENNHVSQEYLASVLNMSEGTVTKLTYRLEKLNLIEREVDLTDKRKKLVTITSEGEQIVDEFHTVIKGFENELRKDFTEEELLILRILLKKMSSVLSKED